MKRVLWVAVVAVGLGAVAFAEEKEIENREFKLWSRFAKGTSVTHKMTTEREMKGAKQKPTESETTLTLKEKTDGMLVLGTEMKPAVAHYTPPDREVLPTIKVDSEKYKEPKKTGTETVKAADGKEYKCDVYEDERDNVNAAGKSHTKFKVWVCEDVPGGTVKTEVDTKGDTMSSHITMELIKFDKK